MYTIEELLNADRFGEDSRSQNISVERITNKQNRYTQYSLNCTNFNMTTFYEKGVGRSLVVYQGGG